jgi:hypothetical protein
MNKKLPDTKSATKTIHDDNPEWTAADFKKAVRFDGLPQPLQKKLRGRRGPQKAPRKIQTAIR